MSSLMTELNAARSRPMSPESEKPPPNCCHAVYDVPECHTEVSVQTAPYTDFTALSISDPPHQDMSSAAALDPFNHSRIHAPCQPAAECPKPQLDPCDPLTGPAPGPSDSSSAAAMWISEGSFLSGGMVDSHQLVTVDVDSQWFGGGLLEASSHITHQVLRGDGGGLQLPPSQPGFWTLFPNDCASAGKGDDNIFKTPPQPAHSRGDGGIQTADAPSTASAQRAKVLSVNDGGNRRLRQSGDIFWNGRAVRPECDSRPRKTCHCTKSRCLKLYCDCFSSGMMCSSCNCINCHNNTENESQRHEAIKLCLGRNPGAFRSKGSAGTFDESRGWPGRGCSCRHSGCLKKYCDCYEANVKCTSSCRCVGCCNYDNRGGAAELVSAVGVETLCQSLLAQALHAEQRSLSAAAAQRLLLEQFGRHLAQIVRKL